MLLPPLGGALEERRAQELRRDESPGLFLPRRPAENREVARDRRGRGEEATTNRKPLTRHTAAKGSYSEQKQHLKVSNLLEKKVDVAELTPFFFF